MTTPLTIDWITVTVLFFKNQNHNSINAFYYDSRETEPALTYLYHREANEQRKPFDED